LLPLGVGQALRFPIPLSWMMCLFLQQSCPRKFPQQNYIHIQILERSQIFKALQFNSSNTAAKICNNCQALMRRSQIRSMNCTLTDQIVLCVLFLPGSQL
jgi:hypothetical protein